ncbi:MAG: glycosyltransferase family 2 protein [Planctomycetaceae bacterium]|jgi:dolichol-phosphate mannosyltransferase|nr:glycosyltransferase family 2 protein [Planctomycetaceae bacterium]
MMLSIVIPVYNEEESLTQLHREIDDVAKNQQIEIEIIFIDDGSRDCSWEIIERLAKNDARIQAIRFRRNFGKAAALNAGFAAANGEIVLTMDADLQDDPREIPEFLKMMETSLDVVSGWKKVRHDPWHKVIPSRFFNGMVSWLTGVKLHDHNCGMKIYRRQIFDEVTLYGELHRFVPVLAASRGYKVGEKVIAHRARSFGQSKYGFTRFVKGFLDLLTVKFITGYGQRPQHLLGTFGLCSFAIGGLVLAYLAVRWGYSHLLYELEYIKDYAEVFKLADRPAVLYSVAFLLLGGQLVSMGIIAELFIAYHNRRGADYSIANRIVSRLNPPSNETDSPRSAERSSTD